MRKIRRKQVGPRITKDFQNKKPFELLIFKSLVSFAKTLAGCEINNIAAAVSRQLSVITPGHVSIHPPVPRNAGSLLSRATESAPRESCLTPTTCRAEAAGR